MTGVGFLPRFAVYKKDLATFSHCDGPGYCSLPQDNKSCPPNKPTQYELVKLPGVQQVSMSKAILLPPLAGVLEVVTSCGMGVGLILPPYLRSYAAQMSS